MARSSTSFQPGNKPVAGFQPGNKLAVRHGAYSLEAIEAELPAVRAQLVERMAANPIPRQEVDDTIVERYCWAAARAKLLERDIDAGGGPLTEYGKTKPAMMLLLQIWDRLEKMERSMGLGALGRAQVLQLTSSGQRDRAEVEARYTRMRSKQVRVIEGAG